MANRIKGITVEIGGDTTKLSKALESVNKSIKGTQSGLKDVNKLLKLDPSNTELVVQKQKMLKDAIEATKEKLATLKTAAQSSLLTVRSPSSSTMPSSVRLRRPNRICGLYKTRRRPRMRPLPRSMKPEKSSRTSDLLWRMSVRSSCR